MEVLLKQLLAAAWFLLLSPDIQSCNFQCFLSLMVVAPVQPRPLASYTTHNHVQQHSPLQITGGRNGGCGKGGNFKISSCSHSQGPHLSRYSYSTKAHWYILTPPPVPESLPVQRRIGKIAYFFIISALFIEKMIVSPLPPPFLDECRKWWQANSHSVQGNQRWASFLFIGSNHFCLH